jgi:hypothetical protein
MTITHCPACGCQIYYIGHTKSHETRADCFAALDMESESTDKRRKHLIKLELDDRKRLQEELEKIYRVNE